MIPPQVDGFAIAETGGDFRRESFLDEPLLGNLPLEGLLQNGPRDLEELFAVLEEPPSRNTDMALFGGLVQHIGDATFRPQRRIQWNAQALGNLVGGKKADAGDIHGQPIGIFPDHFEGGLAVVFENARGKGRADPMTAQEDHELADVLLVFPGFADLVEAIHADALDFAEPLRAAVDDLEGLRSKTADDPFGHDRADPFDETGPEVLANALDRIRYRRVVAVDFELFAKAGVDTPGAFHAQHFAGGQ